MIGEQKMGDKGKVSKGKAPPHMSLVAMVLKH